MKHTLVALALVSAALFVAKPALAQDTVRVHIDTTNPNVVLEKRTYAGWVEVCSGKCDRDVRAGLLYRVSGKGVQPSRKFELTAAEEGVNVHVETRSAATHAVGWVSLFTGVLGVGSSLGILITSALDYRCSNCVSGYADTTMLNVGWTMLATSALFAFVGFVVIMTTNSDVTLTSTRPPTVPDEWGGVARSPLRERRAVDALPPIVGIPIFGTSF